MVWLHGAEETPRRRIQRWCASSRPFTRNASRRRPIGWLREDSATRRRPEHFPVLLFEKCFTFTEIGDRPFIWHLIWLAILG